jgi:transcription termination factor Rho
MYDILELNDKLVNELKEIARLMEIPNYDELRKQELIYKILDQQALNPGASNSIRESLSAKFPKESTKVEFKESPVVSTKKETAETAERPKRKRVIPGDDSELRKAPVVLEPSVKVPANKPAPIPTPPAAQPVSTEVAERTTEQPARNFVRQESDRNYNQNQQNNNFRPRREQVVPEPAIDPDTLIPAEGVLEIMPDGFGFLRLMICMYRKRK